MWCVRKSAIAWSSRVQDVLRDAPFSRLNLLCCRNLMIYLDTAAQKKLLPLFHYTLRPRRLAHARICRNHRRVHQPVQAP